MEKRALVDHPVHDLIADRWSPRAFTEQPIPAADLRSMLEAARWAASAYNDQPWYFLLAERGDQTEFQRLLDCLVEANQVWAQSAAVLMIAVMRTTYAHNGSAYHHAMYDTGQAVATMIVQATALGIKVHQMAGFDAQRARETYAIPEGYEAVTAIALGYGGDPDSLPDKLRTMELGERTRRPLPGTVFTGTWASPSPVLSND